MRNKTAYRNHNKTATAKKNKIKYFWYFWAKTKIGRRTEFDKIGKNDINFRIV